MLAFSGLSPGFTDATSSTTVDPAGSVAPFEPITGALNVATSLSPGWLELVQTRAPDAMVSAVPAPISRRAGPVAMPVPGDVTTGSGAGRMGAGAWTCTCCGGGGGGAGGGGVTGLTVGF